MKQIEMTIEEKEGMVVIGLAEPRSEISMHPDVAANVAQEINRLAGKGKLVMQSQGMVLTLEKRKSLINRFKTRMAGLHYRNTSPEKIATEMVDMILHEVM
jgi:hypothetical protein